jgi:hypothetical protein
MIHWKYCYEVPRTCSYWEGIGGDITVAHADGKTYSMTSDEFAVRYTSRRPAPGEIRDDLRASKAENERLRADNERLRSHAATIKHLMDGPVQIPTTTIWAELCKMTDCK